MGHVKDTTGTSEPTRLSKRTNQVSTSVVAERQRAQRLVCEWLSIEQGFDPSAYLNEICNLFHVTPEDVLGERRHSQLVKSRHLFWACLREHGKWSYPVIGDYVGRDHTTVMVAIKKVPSDLVQAVGNLVFSIAKTQGA
jgi:chromosomal replication initiation ATPase DnaA